MFCGRWSTEYFVNMVIFSFKCFAVDDYAQQHGFKFGEWIKLRNIFKETTRHGNDIIAGGIAWQKRGIK